MARLDGVMYNTAVGMDIGRKGRVRKPPFDSSVGPGNGTAAAAAAAVGGGSQALGADGVAAGTARRLLGADAEGAEARSAMSAACGFVSQASAT